MVSLDDSEGILKFSGNQKIVDSIKKFKDQVVQSWNEIFDFSFSTGYEKINSIVFCGMGGSRFPALIVKELFKEELKLPFIINDEYILPEFINENSLVIASSYSGTTEEVLANVTLAKAKGAKIFGITSGGQLAKMLSSFGFPCYIFKPINNPSNQPRMGIGYALGAIFGVFTKLNLLGLLREEVEKSFQWIEESAKSFTIEVPENSNVAKVFARKVYEKSPVFVVSEFLKGTGNALANQTNETAKSYSEFRIIPELNHHLMEGLKHPDAKRKIDIFLFLYSSLYSKEIQKRFKITKEVIEKNKIETLWYESRGSNKIEQVFDVLNFGLYFTFYLSFLYQENPLIVPWVNYFKKRLKN